MALRSSTVKMRTQKNKNGSKFRYLIVRQSSSVEEDKNAKMRQLRSTPLAGERDVPSPEKDDDKNEAPWIKQRENQTVQQRHA